MQGRIGHLKQAVPTRGRCGIPSHDATLMNKMVCVVVVLAAFLALGPVACTPKPEPITVAWSPFEHGVLLWVGEDQGMFRQNGLDVTLRKYDTGAGSLNGMLNGEADVTVGVTEFPMVKSAFTRSRARIIGAAAKVEQLYLVGRRDRGIGEISDLKGKRVGTTFGTIAEFYLGRFLQVNGFGMQDIVAVDLKTPAEWENAVAEGVVDAIVTAQPYADLAANRLGSNAIVWATQGGQYIFGLIVSSEEWTTAHPELVDRFLKSLALAEEYVARHPAEAKAMMQNKLNVDASFAESAWSRDQFFLSLDQSLVLAMEDEARWMIDNGLTNQKVVPDFMEYIYVDGLKAVRPEAVNLIR